MAIKLETAQLQKGKQTERNAFPSIKLRRFCHGAAEDWAEEEEEAMGSDIYTAETVSILCPWRCRPPCSGDTSTTDIFPEIGRAHV